MIKNAIITFDYELFLGKQTGTIKNCVIKPTQLVLEVLRQNHARAIFFVDATWLLFIKKNSPDDLKLVSEQLKEIIRIGSSVELHIHPQWINAYVKENSIGFESYANYKLHSFRKEDIFDLFKASIELLESITREKIRCFRAGGFCIEPFDQIKPVFEMFEIKYDFSIVPGLYLKSGNPYDFDFSDAPKLLYYSFQNDVKVPEPLGNFIEVPISTYNNNPLYRFSNSVLLLLKKDRIVGDGKGIQQELSFFSRLISKRLGFSKGTLTLDQTSTCIFSYLLSTHFRKTPLLVIISHPKMISNQALLNLSYVTKLCNTLNSKSLDGSLNT